MSTCAIITGVGLVTPLGNSASQTWDALLAGRYIASHARAEFQSAGSLPRISQLAIAAVTEACASSSRPADALIVGTSKGPIEQWLSSPGASTDHEDRTSLGLADTAFDVADALRISGPRLTLSAACASGLHALIRGVLLIQSGEASRVLVVAAEASIHPLFIASFQRLGVVASLEIGCRPFDRARDGFLMSEAAAAVLLDAGDEHAPGIRVDRFAFGADATHLTGADPQARALRHILSKVIDHRPIDLLHAHGTGTQANDEIELGALDDLVSASELNHPIVYSHKAALGHSLGAAGLVSVVLNVLSHQTGIIPGNLRTPDPLPAAKISIPRENVRRNVRRSLASAAGFGGAIGAVTLVSSDFPAV